MGGVGRTQGPHKYRGGAGSGRPSAGVSLGYILGGGYLHLVPQAPAAGPRPGGPPMVGTGLTSGTHARAKDLPIGPRAGPAIVADQRISDANTPPPSLNGLWLGPPPPI